MRTILCIFLLPFFYLGYSQDTTYLDSNRHQISKDSIYKYFKVIQKADKKDTIVRTYNRSGNLVSEEYFADYENGIRKGSSKDWYDNGVLKSDIEFSGYEFSGFVKTYWPNGNIKRIDKFRDGNFIRGKCYDSTGIEIKHFDFIVLPEYPGGLKKLNQFLLDNIKYPEEAERLKITGRVIVKFIVLKDGTCQATIEKGVHPLLDNEALRVVKLMPKWEPGYMDGEYVVIYRGLPIVFHLK